MGSATKKHLNGSSHATSPVGHNVISGASGRDDSSDDSSDGGNGDDDSFTCSEFECDSAVAINQRGSGGLSIDHQETGGGGNGAPSNTGAMVFNKLEHFNTDKKVSGVPIQVFQNMRTFFFKSPSLSQDKS